MKLSVWLVPAPQGASVLADLIERGAKTFGSPAFPPHITLCGEPTETTLRSDLVLELPLTVTFGGVGFGGDYFHSCYLTLRDDASVLALQARAATALGGRVPDKHAPHLSLVYGALTDEQRQEAASLVAHFPTQVEFDRVEIWETSGAVSTWRRQV